MNNLEDLRIMRIDWIMRALTAHSDMTKQAWLEYVRAAEDMIEFLEGRL